MQCGQREHTAVIMESLADVLLQQDFELRLKDGVNIPSKYTLVLGLKSQGSILAKSMEGVPLFSKGEVGWKRGGTFGQIYLGNGFVVVAAEVELYSEQGGLVMCLKKQLFPTASKIVILESIPWSMLKAWEHTGMTLGASETEDCIVSYNDSQTLAIKESLGALALIGAAGQSAVYYLHITVENALSLSDCQKFAKEITSKEGIVFSQNRMRTAVRSALQGSAYI